MMTPGLACSRVDVGSDRREHEVFDGLTAAGDADGDGLDDAVDLVANIPVPLPTGRFTTSSPVTLNHDADGLANYLDVDNDNDGIPDVVELTPNAGGALLTVDTDSDSIPDYLDLDSDNDLLFDAVEAVDPTVTVLDGFVAGDLDAQDGLVDFPVDQGTVITPFASNSGSDGDTIPDYRDIDSDKDGNGIEDIVDIRNGFSSNDNGTVDQTELDDEQVPPSFSLNDPIGTASNGVADAVEEAGSDSDDGISQERDRDSTRFGANATLDQDSDGFASSSNSSNCAGSLGPDLDNDNDGISNSIENGIANQDVDGDGLPNCFDLDSDNDGISDIAESGYIEQGLLTDNDADGRVDNLVDTDPNGSHNATQFVAPVDTDGDGTPDFVDVDSDDDGLSDLRESLLYPEIGSLIDGAFDLAPSPGAGGSIDISNRPNGEPLFLEFIDPARDVDANGFVDRMQPGAVNSAVEVGGGGGSIGIPTFILLFIALARRWKLAVRALVFFVSLGFAFSSIAATQCATSVSSGTPFAEDYDAGFARCAYLGAGGVFSLLEPEGVDQFGFTGEEENSEGLKLAAGYRFSRRFFVEAEYADLGEVELSSSFVGDQSALDYSYSAIAAGGYLFREAERFNVYARGGYANLDVESDGAVVVDQEEDNFFIWGGGIEYRHPQTAWFARLSFDYVSEDAQSVGFTINRYFGGPGKKRTGRTAGVEQESDRPAGIVEAIEQVSAAPEDVDVNSVQSEYSDLSAEAIRQLDCELLDSPLAGFSFEAGQVSLDNDDRKAFSRHINAMKRNDDLLVEISSYASEDESAAANRSLAGRRAQAIAVLFRSEGVPEKQLLTRGFSRERISVDSASQSTADKADSRIEFRVMNIGLCFE